MAAAMEVLGTPRLLRPKAFHPTTAAAVTKVSRKILRPVAALVSGEINFCRMGTVSIFELFMSPG